MALTPKGTLTGFIAIETPSQKFGTYSCKMAFEGAEAKAMKAAIDKHMADSAAKAGGGNAKPPYVVANKQLIVNFKQKAEVKSKTGKVYEFTVKLFDCKGKEVEEVLGIGEGTECRISYSPYMWNVQSQGGAGVTMQLEMVQIIKLVKYEGGGSGGNPFDAVDGDYVAAVKDSNPFEEDDAIEDDDDGDF